MIGFPTAQGFGRVGMGMERELNFVVIDEHQNDDA